MVEDKQLKFDIASQRLRDIAEWVTESERAYYRLMTSKVNTYTRKDEGPNIDYRDYRQWYGAISTVWKLVKPYIDDEDEVEKMEDLREPLKEFSLYGGEGSEVYLDDIEDFHDKVNQLRIDVGLDIPRTQEENPVEKFREEY